MTLIVSRDRKLPTIPNRHDIISDTMIEIFRPRMPADSYNYRCIGKITPADLSLFLQNENWSVFSLPEN